MTRSTRLMAMGVVLAIIAGAALAQSQPRGQRQQKAAGQQWNSLSKQEADYCNQAARKEVPTGSGCENFVQDCVSAQDDSDPEPEE